jgi:aminopeptidase YwaD
MTEQHLSEAAEGYLRRLCVEITERRVGSDGNRLATDFVAERWKAFGWTVERPAFACMDWSDEGADLSADGTSFDARVSPHSLGGQAHAPLVVVSTVDELESADLEDKIALLRGEIAKEQLMPKNFPWWNPDEHRRIISLLEAKRPAAIIAATGRNPELAGAVYPFPMFEDGDLDIPSVYMTEEEGARVAALAGEAVLLDIRATRRPATGCSVIARRGPGNTGRVVVIAHIDTKAGTPGALDDAAGISVLLLLAELLKTYAGNLCVELVAMNGEDYYDSPGEKLYLATAGDLNNVALAINIDGAGYREGDTAYSLYECPAELEAAIRKVFAGRAGMAEGEQWYQGDHSIFVQASRPSLAITSADLGELMRRYTHTPADRPEIVDAGKLVGIAQALTDLITDYSLLVTSST